MQSQAVSGNTSGSTRLHYLDWLRVLAMLGVFFFHAVHPFDYSDWHIKNAELSMAVTVVLGLLFPWGLALFFMLAGTGSWFALRRRTAGQYASERVRRLPLVFAQPRVSALPLVSAQPTVSAVP